MDGVEYAAIRHGMPQRSHPWPFFLFSFGHVTSCTMRDKYLRQRQLRHVYTLTSLLWMPFHDEDSLPDKALEFIERLI